VFRKHEPNRPITKNSLSQLHSVAYPLLGQGVSSFWFTTRKSSSHNELLKQTKIVQV